LDTTEYPNWYNLANTIKPSKLTTYMNPYLANTVTKNKQHFRRDLFAEAASFNYLVQNTSGLPYIQSSASKSFTFGMIHFFTEYILLPHIILLIVVYIYFFLSFFHIFNLFFIVHFSSGTIDLTNPKARDWTSRLIRCNILGDQNGCDGNATAVSARMDGWMSDFGEYLPWDASLYSGEPASKVHNQFPELWSR
jgi:alpha-glucosidase (family GH31 glycosyl hydrolase)